MKKALTLALTAAASVALAEPPPQQIDIHNLPGGAQVVDRVVIPVPTEIFGVLDRLGRPVWQDVLRPVPKDMKSPGSRAQTALLLGSVIAEGFVAVEAQNAEEVKNIGKVVLDLASALNVRKVVVPRSQAITQSAEKNDWPAVRRELDKAQHEVQAAMQELSDEPLSQLVSLGGWLRGTEALTQVLMQKNYKEDAPELLHQKALLEFFLHRISTFSPRLKNDPLVVEMNQGLQKLQPTMGDEKAPITDKVVGEIHKITERLNTAIHPKNP